MEDNSPIAIDFEEHLPNLSQTIDDLRCEAKHWPGKTGLLSSLAGLIEISPDVNPPQSEGLWIKARLGVDDVIELQVTKAQAERLSGLTIEHLSEKDAVSILEEALSSWLDNFEDENAISVHILEVSEQWPASEVFHRVRLRRPDGELLTHLACLSKGAIKFLDQKLQYPRVNPVTAKRLRIDCSFAIASYALSYAQLNSLRLGDVFFCYREAEPPTGWVSVGQDHGFSARRQDDGFLALSPLKRTPRKGPLLRELLHGAEGSIAMTEKQAEEGQVSSETKENVAGENEVAEDTPNIDNTLDPNTKVENPIGEVELIVQAVTTEFTASIEELLSLHEGDLLKIPAGPVNQVNLMVNNLKIGTAQFVKLKDAIALEIISLAK